MNSSAFFPSFFSKLIVLVFAVGFFWWLGMFITNSQDTLANNSYGLLLGILPILGGINGLLISKQWGGFSSALGKAISFLSLGLIFWGCGSLIFSGYYNLYSDVEVPYPSLADLGYVLSLPLWTIGMLYLSKATGARFGMQKTLGKIFLVVIPIVAVIFSYYFLVVVARGGVLELGGGALFLFGIPVIPKVFFDLGYPIGDVVILALATLIYTLSYKYFGGRYKKAIYFLLGGFVLMYIADFSFSYTTTLETFYVGNWLDFLFVATMFVLSYAVSLFDHNALNKGQA